MLHIKTGLAINLPRWRLNNRREYDVKYESRYVEMGRSCDKKGVRIYVCVLARLVFITHIRVHLCVGEKKKLGLPPRAIKLNTRGGKKKAFICPGVTPDGCLS